MNGKKPIDIAKSEKIIAMLNNHKFLEEVTAIEEVNEMHLTPNFDYAGIMVPSRPPKVQGNIVTISSFFKRKKIEFFELNPIEGTLTNYLERKNCPGKPKEIYNLLNIKDLSIISTNETFGFHVFFHSIINFSSSTKVR